MVFLSSAHRKRTPLQRIVRFGLGIAAVSLIIYVLSILPYDILREERFRIYGESRTTGVVTGVKSVIDPSSSQCFRVEYKFIDDDGYARQGTADMPESKWKLIRPGSRIVVLYVRSRPELVRVEGEIEPPFQVWLRKVLH